MTSGTKNYLNGVWGSSPSDVFTVGLGGGKILHYDGNAWSNMPTGTSNTFYAVWGSSSSDVFATEAPSGIIHYNGKTWSKITQVFRQARYGASGVVLQLMFSLWVVKE
jgi:hypothetical protein